MILEAINKKAGKEKNILTVFPNLDPKNFDIKLLINNIEVPIDKAFLELENQLDRMIKAKAEEIIVTKLLDLNDAMSLLHEKVIETIHSRLSNKPVTILE